MILIFEGIKFLNNEIQTLDKERTVVKATHITNAVLIGFLIGIVLYSIAKNSWGFFTLIPLFFVYKLINHSKQEDQ